MFCLANNQQDSTLPLINDKPLKKMNHHNLEGIVQRILRGVKNKLK
jgi:hypothetical protein